MKRHRFDPFAFVFGALFVFLSLFVLTGNSVGDLGGLWAAAIVGIVTAALIVLYAARSLFTPSGRPDEPSADERLPDEL
jgi:hypothetical protein